MTRLVEYRGKIVASLKIAIASDGGVWNFPLPMSPEAIEQAPALDAAFKTARLCCAYRCEDLQIWRLTVDPADLELCLTRSGLFADHNFTPRHEIGNAIKRALADHTFAAILGHERDNAESYANWLLGE